jgi:hypothetical protein
MSTCEHQWIVKDDFAVCRLCGAPKNAKACPHGQLARQCPLCERDAEIARLRAGIEQEAAYCEKWQGEAILAGDLDRAGRHEERAARLRALLEGKS